MQTDGQDIISASEIGEYEFCSVSWYLNKEGYPRSGYSSRRMETGREMHRQVDIGYRRSNGALKAFMIVLVLLVIGAAILYYGYGI